MRLVQYSLPNLSSWVVCDLDVVVVVVVDFLNLELGNRFLLDDLLAASFMPQVTEPDGWQVKI